MEKDYDDLSLSTTQPFTIGQLVRSKKGRDRGSFYLVIGIEKSVLLLSDGRKRGLSHPKRKNMLHVQPTRKIAADFARQALLGSPRDEQIRQGLISLTEGSGFIDEI